MTNRVRRIYACKREEYDIESDAMLRDIRENLRIDNLEGLKVINRYDIEGIPEEVYEASKDIVFSELPVDNQYEEEIELSVFSHVFVVEYLPGQYDQRADSAQQCVQILSHGKAPLIKTAKLIALKGNLTEDEYATIKDYCINPIEARQTDNNRYESLIDEIKQPDNIDSIIGFIDLNELGLQELIDSMGLAMDLDDITFCQNYFRNSERRDPTETEIRVVDTYWSDHCRHTTFSTSLDSIEFEDGEYKELLENAYKSYKDTRDILYKGKDKKICLMDLATIAMKKMKSTGVLDDLDESDEINACSIEVDAEIDGEIQKWLVMFKNETHNHPTEIEPFGGAATCLGGAIRDPLSGRSFVYQAMRVTGSGNPTVGVKDTINGKLPQRKITTGAAEGYSSYGNQIGLATGLVHEIYDEGYKAKRMEIGAVIGAAPKEYVRRSKPKSGDVVILVGGRTGRDGIGGATGSSKAHTEESLQTCGAEVQKGNPVEERKIQRLFRNPEATKLIKKCNDFGAGGVCVAIGELSDGLEIDLDKVPKKYEGLNGTEIAISESQERMAVVVDSNDADSFIEAAARENLTAVKVAQVRENKRLKMIWRGHTIVDISREFLDSNGADKSAFVTVENPIGIYNFFKDSNYKEKDLSYDSNVKDIFINNMMELNVCSQKGLVERFDSTIGAYSVLMPYGGKYQRTPIQSMISKLPVEEGDTDTATIMTYGFCHELLKISPFHGAVYSVLESAAKVTAAGANYKRVRLSMQEYFERLGKDPIKWGRPFAALLGAFYAQDKLNLPAIGGKDSMSGTFNDISVPPTLVSFAVTTMKTNEAISPEFKTEGNKVVLIDIDRDKDFMPDFDSVDKTYSTINKLIKDGTIVASYAVDTGGVAAAVTKMAFGNMFGFRFNSSFKKDLLFKRLTGSIVAEVNSKDIESMLLGLNYYEIGCVIKEREIDLYGNKIALNELYEAWTRTLDDVFPTTTGNIDGNVEIFEYKGNRKLNIKSFSNCTPKVFIPVFPGTNCEYDTSRAFKNAGAITDVFVFKNRTPQEVDESIKEMANRIKKAQILMLAGGFSAGDEPDGSGKFIAAVFRNTIIKDAVNELLYNRDGLALGICNGFQALIKLGLLPYGKIINPNANMPTLTFNKINRHISSLVKTRVCSAMSPWFSNVSIGDLHTIPVSHGEGRFIASNEQIEVMKQNGQVATQYVDDSGNPTLSMPYNPNGSYYAVEGIFSPDGRVFGKMGHSERIGQNIAKNVPGDKNQKIFEAGVSYFK